jgi:hypothetical protein
MSTEILDLEKLRAQSLARELKRHRFSAKVKGFKNRIGL